MTPSMLAVAALLAVATLLDGDEPREPATKPSRPSPIAEGMDTHVMIRSLAEQLVSEANTVLRERDVGISLVDS